MSKDVRLSNLSWLSFAESKSLANSLSTSFKTGIDIISIERTGKGRDVVRGVAFANANASSAAVALANSQDNFVAFAFADAEALSSASSFSIGLSNRSKLMTGKGRDVVRGISFANALADANSSAQAAAVTDFGLAVSIANNKASAYADAFSVGIHNAHRAVIKTKSGGDVVSGRAFANASASAVTETTSFVAGLLASSQAEVKTIDVATALTVLGINNNVTLKTGRGGDKFKGVAVGNGTAWAKATTTIAFAIANTTAAANATARVSATISTISIGLNNNGAANGRGLVTTGRGHDEITGVGIAENSSAIAAASSAAQAAGKRTTSQAVTFTTVKSVPNEGIGINNVDGLIDTGQGNDTVNAYGHTYGLVGGTVNLGNGDDILHAGIIKNHTSKGRVKSFVRGETGALERVRVDAGSGDDRLVLHSIFGDNVLLDGGQGFDRLQLPGRINQYKISAGQRSLSFERQGATLSVQNIEQFDIGKQTFALTELAAL